MALIPKPLQYYIPMNIGLVDTAEVKHSERSASTENQGSLMTLLPERQCNYMEDRWKEFQH